MTPRARTLQTAWQSVSGLAKITTFRFGYYTTLKAVGVWAITDAARLNYGQTDTQPRQTNLETERTFSAVASVSGLHPLSQPHHCLINPTTGDTKPFAAQFTVHASCPHNTSNIQIMSDGIKYNFGHLKSRHLLGADEKHRAPVAINQKLICVGRLPKQMTVVSVGAWWHGKIELWKKKQFQSDDNKQDFPATRDKNVVGYVAFHSFLKWSDKIIVSMGRRNIL